MEIKIPGREMDSVARRLHSPGCTESNWFHRRTMVEEDLFTVEHDSVPGRLRLRTNLLRGQSVRHEALGTRLREVLAGAEIETRPATGSIVIRFDPGISSRRILEEVSRVLLSPPPLPERQGRAQIVISGREPRPLLQNVTAPPKPKAHHGTTGGDWHALTRAELLERLDLEGIDGLDATDVEARLRSFGPNSLPRPAQRSKVAMLAKQFDSLPVKMLLGSMVISGASGGLADAMATLAVVLLNGAIGYVTEGQAEQTISRIATGQHDGATVVRNGAPIGVPADALVPGDLVLLKPGVQVPADLRILWVEDLLVDESALTGESLPVEKRPAERLPRGISLAERFNLAHAGTLVAAGRGRGLVVATGVHTEAAQVQLLSEASVRPRARIEVELDALGARLAKFTLLACGAFFGIGIFRGYGAAEMLREALSLAVAAVPEGLPTVATTTLALGLRRMERQGILIRSLEVVESLGEMQTLCLDKTGTLTQNRMHVVCAVTPTARFDSDTAPFPDDPGLRTLAELASLNNDAAFHNGEPSADGASGTELALLRFAVSVGMDVAALREVAPRVVTIPRSADRPFMATVHDRQDGARFTLLKGSPEHVLAHCRWLQTDIGPQPMTDEDRAAIIAQNKELSLQQARVLAFAQGTSLPDGNGVPHDLTWVGLVALADPIRPGARDFIRDLHTAGIETVLITGDQAATAQAVAEDLGLSNGAPLQVIDAANIEQLDPELLAGLAANAHVFARVSPRQKLLIVRALQTAGRIVGMTGDGVNDGPALKAAHVGIAMGASGSDLAREVANVVIRDDELPTLIKAIAQGRAIHRNIRRALEFLVVTNLSEIIVEIVEAAHGPGELETPLELLWINLATDVAPGIGLALADPDEDAMRMPPRPHGESIIPPGDLRRMGGDSAVIAATTLGVHFMGLSRYGPGPQTRGMTFLTLSLGQLLYAMGCQRRDPRKLRIDRLLENRKLDTALIVSIGFTALPYLVPALGRALGITRPAGIDLATALAASAVPLARVLLKRGIHFDRELIQDAP
jgi:P-type Ca2+ transporter type 2C